MTKLKYITVVFLLLILSSVFSLKSTVVFGKEEVVNDKNASYYLYDFNSKTEIMAKNENKKMPIASMTKIMLLLLCYENISNNGISLDQKITVSENANSFGGSQVFLEANSEYLLGDLLKSVTVASANDASVALAEYFYGSEQACVDAMNKKVESLGLKNTLFANCTGLPKPMQYSTAKDIAIIFSKLIEYEKYFNYSSIWLDKIQHKNNYTEISNTNKLIKFYNGCDGGKTGFTNEAGFCLTATAKRGNMRLIASVLKAETSKDRFNTVSSLFNYGFNNFSNKVLVDSKIKLDDQLMVVGGKTDKIDLRPQNDFYVFAKRNENLNIELKYNYASVNAPVKVGDVVGEIVVYKDGVEIGKVNVVSDTEVLKSSYFDNIGKLIKNW